MKKQKLKGGKSEMKKTLAILVLSVMCLILVGSIAQAAMLTSTQKLEAKQIKKAEIAKQKEVVKAQKEALKAAKKDLKEIRAANKKPSKNERPKTIPREETESTTDHEETGCSPTINGISRGDIDKNGVVSQNDLPLFLQTYGTERSQVSEEYWGTVQLADINCDNKIDLTDLSLELSRLN